MINCFNTYFTLLEVLDVCEIYQKNVYGMLKQRKKIFFEIYVSYKC